VHLQKQTSGNFWGTHVCVEDGDSGMLGELGALEAVWYVLYIGRSGVVACVCGPRAVPSATHPSSYKRIRTCNIGNLGSYIGTGCFCWAWRSEQVLCSSKEFPWSFLREVCVVAGPTRKTPTVKKCSSLAGICMNEVWVNLAERMNGRTQSQGGVYIHVVG
jgi:hypothetical protein